MAQNGTQIEDEKTEQGPYDAMIMIIRKLHCYRIYSIFSSIDIGWDGWSQKKIILSDWNL